MRENKIIRISVCPRCGQAYREHPALSRLDNETLICPDCGTREALDSIGVKPDEQEQISGALRLCADEKRIGLIVTTGGTGLSPRDVTPEATRAVLEREIPAIPVAMWMEGLKVTPRAMLSRAVAGIRGSSLLLNLPGSEKAAQENLAAVIGALEHGLHMIAAEGHE